MTWLITYQYDRCVHDGGFEKRLAEIEKRAEQRRFRDGIVARVRELAAASKILWSDHAFERVDLREINDLTAKRILERGDLKDDLIEPGENEGEWKLTMVDRVKPNRDAGVVAVVIQDKRLLVITVEWEDL